LSLRGRFEKGKIFIVKRAFILSSSIIEKFSYLVILTIFTCFEVKKCDSSFYFHSIFFNSVLIGKKIAAALL